MDKVYIRYLVTLKSNFQVSTIICDLQRYYFIDNIIFCLVKIHA